jgi:hypothetical protein
VVANMCQCGEIEKTTRLKIWNRYVDDCYSIIKNKEANAFHVNAIDPAIILSSVKDEGKASNSFSTL